MPIESFDKWSPRVHPAAFVHPAATLIGDVEIGEEATIWPAVTLRGDSGAILIGARTSIQDGSVGHATDGVSRTVVGPECVVGHRVILHGCIVGARCLIGMGSTVMDNVEIGDDSFLAAGSLVPPGKKFPPRSFLIGSPAKLIRQVTDKEREAIDHGWKTYVELCRRYRSR